MQNKIPDISFNHLQGASGFEIMRLSELFKREKFISHKLHQPHRLKFYQMIYITKGTGAHTVDFYTFNISHKILGEGNFVLALSEGIFMKKHVTFYDLFRIENGKVVEHWDTIEDIPSKENWQNQNGKFNL
jgi:hypothetical protein